MWIYQGHGQTEERSQDQARCWRWRLWCPNQPSAAGAQHTIHPFKVPSPVGFSIFTRLCNHYNHLFLEQSHHPLKKPHALGNHSHSPSPSPWQLLSYCLSLWVRLFRTFPINEITQYLPFCDCFS